MLRHKIYVKGNTAYLWCELSNDNSLIFGYDSGDSDKITLSINSYQDKNMYFNDVQKRLKFYKETYPSYYNKIIKLGSYITKEMNI